MSDFKPDIWKLQSQFNTQGLVQALNDEDSGIRRRAAAALRALGAIDAIPIIQGVLDKESDPETRANLASALDGLQQEKERREKGLDTGQLPNLLPDIERLIRQLEDSDDPDKIMETATALGNLGDKQAVPALMTRFTDPKIPIKVRLIVAEALLKLESAPVEVTLLGALRSDDWRVRRNGAAILGQLKASWAIEPLAQALYDNNEHVRKTAFAALKHIGTDEARTALQQVREDIERRRSKPDKAATQDVSSLQVDAAPGDEAESPNDETQKIVWPTTRRQKRSDNPNLAPTKPLDPQTLENYRRRVNNNNSDPSENTPE